MGARPIALPMPSVLAPRTTPQLWLITEGTLVAAIRPTTAICVGVPTVGGRSGLRSSYSGQPLWLTPCPGAMETEEIARSGAGGVAIRLDLCGQATTGRGLSMGGASFASAELRAGLSRRIARRAVGMIPSL